MSYKYINPGYYTLFDGWSSLTSYTPQNRQKTDDYVKNPLNGIGFDHITVFYKIPQNSSVLFFSMGVYVPNSLNLGDFNIEVENDISIAFSFEGKATTHFEKQKNGSFTYNYSFFHKLEYERYNRILCKIDTVLGSLDIWINGEQLYSQVENSVIAEYGDLKDKVIALKDGGSNALYSRCFLRTCLVSSQ